MDKMQKSHGISTKCKLLNLAAADLIVRTAYQMGKTPLLPLFAAGLGANSTFLGFIVSASTLTGMLLKPLFGCFQIGGAGGSGFLLGRCCFPLCPFFIFL